MRILFLGDIVGRPGRDAVAEYLPGLIKRNRIDFVVVNGENAAHGFGLTRSICEDLLSLGVDIVTSGNHVWDQKEALTFITSEDRFLRPVNYPTGTPGRGAHLVESRSGHRVLVINVMGEVFMPSLSDPFAAVEAALGEIRLTETVDAILVDIHAEATSEKQAMGYWLDGRVSLVVGTHTHVPTADERILPNGTGFMSDAGMCGCYQSVLGMDVDEPVQRFVSKISSGRFSPADGPGAIAGVAIDTDDGSGLAKSIAPVRLGPGITNGLPNGWQE